MRWSSLQCHNLVPSLDHDFYATLAYVLTVIGMITFVMTSYAVQQVPKYYELMGYTEEPLPAFTPYAPQMLDQPFMEGAPEEEPGPHPTGLVPELSEWLTMPDSCLLRSQPDLPIGNSSSPACLVIGWQSAVHWDVSHDTCVLTSMLEAKSCLA